MINVDAATSGVDLRYCVALKSLGKDFFLKLLSSIATMLIVRAAAQHIVTVLD